MLTNHRITIFYNIFLQHIPILKKVYFNVIYASFFLKTFVKFSNVLYAVAASSLLQHTSQGVS